MHMGWKSWFYPLIFGTYEDKLPSWIFNSNTKASSFENFKKLWYNIYIRLREECWVLDDYICDITCEEYYNERDYFDEDWVGWDDDYDHHVQQNKSFIWKIQKIMI